MKYFGFLIKALALAGLTIAALIVGSLILQYGFDYCGITKEVAFEKVVTHLRSENLPLEHLAFEQSSGTCTYYFSYRGAGKNYSFTVIDDPIHGVELGRYDYAQESAP